MGYRYKVVLLKAYMNSYSSLDIYRFAIIEKISGKNIGQIALCKVYSDSAIGEIEYCIGQKYWGNGYAGEALSGLIKHLFSNSEFVRLEAYHRIENDKSGKVLKKSSMHITDRLYVIRGKRVLLDADLAIIYGYTTKRLNEQVKRNISKFPADYMFQITDEEVEDLWSQNATANINSKSRSKPYVFTEQGLYMLMTVLRGPLAVKQSKALIRTFKKMKDYILENRDLIGQAFSQKARQSAFCNERTKGLTGDLV